MPRWTGFFLPGLTELSKDPSPGLTRRDGSSEDVLEGERDSTRNTSFSLQTSQPDVGHFRLTLSRWWLGTYCVLMCCCRDAPGSMTVTQAIVLFLVYWDRSIKKHEKNIQGQVMINLWRKTGQGDKDCSQQVTVLKGMARKRSFFSVTLDPEHQREGKGGMRDNR